MSMSFNSKTRLLGIFYLVNAGMSLLMLPFIFFHRHFMSVVFENEEFHKGPNPEQAQQAFEQMQPFFDVMYFGFGLMAVCCVVLNILAGIGLFRHQWKIFIAIVAGLNCLSVPLGTILGVFTFIVLFGDEGEKSFGRADK